MAKSGRGALTPAPAHPGSTPHAPVSVRELRAHRAQPRGVHPRDDRRDGPGRSARARAGDVGAGAGAVLSRSRLRNRDGVHEHVPARELGPRARQHALSLDLRRQRRGRDGAPALPRLLPARGRLRGRRPDADGPDVHGADGRRVGRHLRGARRVRLSLSALVHLRAQSDLPPLVLLRIGPASAGVAGDRRVLHRQPLRRADEQRAGRRRLHGPRGRLRGRRVPAPALHGRTRPHGRLRAVAAAGRAARAAEGLAITLRGDRCGPCRPRRGPSP